VRQVRRMQSILRFLFGFWVLGFLFLLVAFRLAFVRLRVGRVRQLWQFRQVQSVFRYRNCGSSAGAIGFAVRQLRQFQQVQSVLRCGTCGLCGRCNRFCVTAIAAFAAGAIGFGVSFLGFFWGFRCLSACLVRLRVSQLRHVQ
jgi:hypothetical protein